MLRISTVCLLYLFFLPALCCSETGYLGISVTADKFEATTGLRVVDVYDDGAAWVAGLKENDIITRFNGQQVTTERSLRSLASQYEWGDRVRLDILRDGVNQTLDVVLGYTNGSRTYEILTSANLDGSVNWYFNDNTTVVMLEGSAVSITKKQEDGRKETLQLEDDVKVSSLPQRFRDLADKLSVIREVSEGSEDEVSQPRRISYTREVVPSDEYGSAPLERVRFENFQVFPNPSSGQFDVRLQTAASGHLTWNIYDIRGASIASGELSDFDGVFEEQFSLSSKLTGTYLLYIRIGNKKLSQKLLFH